MWHQPRLPCCAVLCSLIGQRPQLWKCTNWIGECVNKITKLILQNVERHRMHCAFSIWSRILIRFSLSQSLTLYAYAVWVLCETEMSYLFVIISHRMWLNWFSFMRLDFSSFFLFSVDCICFYRQYLPNNLFDIFILFTGSGRRCLDDGYRGAWLIRIERNFVIL